MLKVGITGGIGSGKTTVCKVFELLGIPVFYADLQARLLMSKDMQLMNDLKEAFGDSVYRADGSLDRKFLASIVFNDAVQLEKLNSLVHPAVFRAFDTWSSQQSTAYVLKEAAILFESGSHRDCNYTIVVESPVEMRLRRVINRDNVTEEEVRRRMDKQMSEEEKRELADFVLKNDERRLLIPQVLKIHERLVNLDRGVQ